MISRYSLLVDCLGRALKARNKVPLTNYVNRVAAARNGEMNGWLPGKDDDARPDAEVFRRTSTFPLNISLSDAGETSCGRVGIFHHYSLVARRNCNSVIRISKLVGPCCFRYSRRREFLKIRWILRSRATETYL